MGVPQLLVAQPLPSDQLTPATTLPGPGLSLPTEAAPAISQGSAFPSLGPRLKQVSTCLGPALWGYTNEKKIIPVTTGSSPLPPRPTLVSPPNLHERPSMTSVYTVAG